MRVGGILPACSSGRWPHLHLEVHPDQASITDGTAAIATLRLPVTLAVGVDTTTTPTGGQRTRYGAPTGTPAGGRPARGS